MANDREILEGFLRGDSVAARELFVRLRPACVSVLRKQHRELKHAHDEILDAVETTVLEWRLKHTAGDPRFDLDQSIKALAWRLTQQEAKNETRYWSRYEVTGEIEEYEDRLPSRTDAQDGAEVSELLEEMDSLPEDFAAVLRAEADRELNGGPRLEEALGINAAAARKRLERARRELKLRLMERPDDGDKDDSDKDDDDDEA